VYPDSKFGGIPEEPQELDAENNRRWEERRERDNDGMHFALGKGSNNAYRSG